MPAAGIPFVAHANTEVGPQHPHQSVVCPSANVDTRLTVLETGCWCIGLMLMALMILTAWFVSAHGMSPTSA